MIVARRLVNRCEKRLAGSSLLLANFDEHQLPRAALPIISRNLLARDDRDHSVESGSPDEQVSQARIPRA
jgi:hypothetical protein